MQQETGRAAEDLGPLAAFNYSPTEIAAPIASGSFPVDGMLVAPCSIKTLSAIANSYTADLISRTADVCLKEGRPLILLVRETPLHPGHLRLMMQAAQAGAVIFPPVPVFYGHPQTVTEIVDASVGRALARMGIENDVYPKWTGGDSSPKG
jgi:4-hydroxy-3-polyprenylbenzoate decarboxylase